MHTRLSKERIAAIAKDVSDGKISLPELDLPTDADLVAVWALVDSGSSVHVVNALKSFPGSHIEAPPRGAKGFVMANGDRVAHGGFVTVPCKTQEGQTKTIKWKHADVAMPILSTHELSRNNHRVEYEEDYGIIRNKITGSETKFISAGGVYFIKLLVPKMIAGRNRGEGFVRQG